MQYLFESVNSFNPFFVCGILFFLWTITTFFSCLFFPKYEKSFFSSVDSDCRSFVAENYTSSSLGDFNLQFPKNYYPSLALCGHNIFYTYIIGLLLLFSFVWSDVGIAFLSIIFVLLSVAQALVWFDIKHMILPDNYVVMFGVFSLLASVLENDGEFFKNVALSILLLCIFLWVVTNLVKIIFNKDSLGLGDVKLLLAMTPLLGILTYTHVLLLGSLFGFLFWSLCKILPSKSIGEKFPFGPFLLFSWCLTIHYQYAYNYLLAFTF